MVVPNSMGDVTPPLPFAQHTVGDIVIIFFKVRFSFRFKRFIPKYYKGSLYTTYLV